MSNPRQIPEADRWRLYEHEKRAWAEMHPHATPAQYEAAVKKIVEELGL